MKIMRQKLQIKFLEKNCIIMNFIIKKYLNKKEAFSAGVCKLKESFVDFPNKFLMSSVVSCRVVNVVDARPVFQNLGEFCDLIATASILRKWAENYYKGSNVITYNSIESVCASSLFFFFL